MLDRLFMEMMSFDHGEPMLIQHFIKVHAFAAYIGRATGLDPRAQFILEAAAYTHDIGIIPAQKKYGSSAGPLQEKEGPGFAREMLRDLGFDDEAVERVCWLIGHHHTYDPVDGIDHRILIEADFLVNLYEGNATEEAKRHAYENMFETDAGKALMREMFGI